MSQKKCGIEKCRVLYPFCRILRITFTIDFIDIYHIPNCIVSWHTVDCRYLLVVFVFETVSGYIAQPDPSHPPSSASQGAGALGIPPCPSYS